MKMEKGISPDVPPPGLPVVTVIWADPMFWMKLALMVAPSCVLLAKVVGSGDPFQLTVEVWTKFRPFTVRVIEPVPARVVCGEIDRSTGVTL